MVGAELGELVYLPPSVSMCWAAKRLWGRAKTEGTRAPIMARMGIDRLRDVEEFLANLERENLPSQKHLR